MGLAPRASARVRGVTVRRGSSVKVEADIGVRLAARGQTLAVAESCTGGLLGFRVTSVPGSSAWFVGGVVAYANRVKVRMLGVDSGTLKREGAVSAAVARQMAEGARRRFGADFALAVTGIAGPGGATAGKPVGRVFTALAGPEGIRVRRWTFAGGRARVRRASADAALEMLSGYLGDRPGRRGRPAA